MKTGVRIVMKVYHLMNMQYYVKRGFEDDLIKTLENYGSTCILGLAGMGKTITARFVYVKLKEKNVKAIYLTSDESKSVKFNDVEIKCISLRHVWRDKSKDEVIALAHTIAKAIEGSFIGKISEKAER